MDKKIAVIWVSLAMILSLIVIIIEIAPVVEAPTTWYVDDVPGIGPGNPPEDFTSIQDAINTSSDGDTIFVYNGTYYENIEVNKTVNLIGEDTNNTIIDGGGTGVILDITVNWVNITGFTITNGEYGFWFSGSSNTTVKNNIASFNSNGGIILVGSNNNITNNDILNNSIGIGIYGGNINSNNITFNKVIGNNEGIWILDPSMPGPGGGASMYHYISNNIICNNYIGISLMTIDSGAIFGVNITSSNIFNNEYGIYFDCGGGGISGTTISNCTIEYNGIGIYMFQNMGGNYIVHNNVSYNKEYAVYLNRSRNNYIYNNNFISNGKGAQVFDDPDLNFWNDTYPVGGNFWSDYIGFDNFNGPLQNIPGSDGIGDTNYTIDPDSKDNYPLMTPVGYCIFLYEGWNLVSIPFTQPETNLGIVLNSIKDSFDAVQWFNISDGSDSWKHHSTKKPSHLNDLDSIDHYMGFWIHIIKPGGVLFVYSGNKPIVPQKITLYPGWNLVGYPSLINKNRTEALNNISYTIEVDSIWIYHAAAQKWIEVGEKNLFEIGRGYWIHAKIKCDWEVPL
jgi:parallel beta-helix repeat protein